jgi:hypothetical protein
MSVTEAEYKAMTDRVAKARPLPPNLLEKAGIVKPNKKVKNATKSVVDGVAFDSLLERTMYDLLRAANINFEFQKVIVVQPKFRYGGKVIRDIKCVVDFWLPDYNTIVDSKGWSTDISKLKYKLLKHFFFSKNQQPEIYMPGTKPECICLINKLLYTK